ncbi:hypothetical protein H6P81_019734 [Aristolochia fimbriata]|uniref:J domain-containing protein n=1 Tax=Aristolochia fimbriata TaxID=158543 RepID=A0AAV7DUB6_ARIFI|nr:hypothetical protein H6P81_019734 [Aristolochia fimbriata]
MSKAKLYVPAIRYLRSCRMGWRFPSATYQRFEVRGFSVDSVLSMGGIWVSRSCNNWFCSDYQAYSRSFCSKPMEAHSNRCWNCGSDANSVVFLVCQSCRSIQPIDQSVDYFQIFGLEKGYSIEIDGLDRKYKDWQKILHPDLVHSKSEKERTNAAEQSARVIDAYRTLSKPLLRALYLLQLEGIQVDEEKTVSDPELLSEIMEIRETVDEAKSFEELNQIKSQIQQKLEAWSNSLGDAFKNNDFESAKKSIQRMTLSLLIIDKAVEQEAMAVASTEALARNEADLSICLWALLNAKLHLTIFSVRLLGFLQNFGFKGDMHESAFYTAYLVDDPVNNKMNVKFR